MDELEESARRLVSDFHSLDCVRRFEKIRDEYMSSDVYRSLQMISTQQRLASKIEDHQRRKEALAELKKQKEELEQAPIYVNYQSAKREIDDLIAPLRETVI